MILVLPPLPIYNCQLQEQVVSRVEDEELWKEAKSIHLVDTQSGGSPSLMTTVRAFWTSTALLIRFDCEDDRIVATMTEHDDPIYNEDVVEVFISETCALDTYKEFELSPLNVQFDAIIHNDLHTQKTVNTSWNAEGWLTNVMPSNEDRKYWSYYWQIPFSNFRGGTPSLKDEWLINFYRIDRGEQESSDQYMAWSPTGAYNFHIPQRFGRIRFIDGLI